MSKDTPNKQKNIDDVLLSIDSLLDTATDIQLNDADHLDNKATDTTATSSTKSKPQKRPAKAKTPANSNLKNTTAPSENKRTQASTVPVSKKATGKPTKSPTQPDTGQDNSLKVSDIGHKQAAESQIRSTQIPEKIDSLISKDNNKELKSDHSINSQTQSDKDPGQDNDLNDDSVDSLNFTTVDDDLSQAMRELPVLEDIVTAEDLALIGSGKEPPKKILTEAYKRLSLTDKLIEILENQLSDYKVSKLEFEYLHELFDDVIDKENSKK